MFEQVVVLVWPLIPNAKQRMKKEEILIGWEEVNKNDGNCLVL